MSFSVCSKCKAESSMPVCAISCFLCVRVLCRTCAAVSEEELALFNSAGSSMKFLCPDCQKSCATCSQTSPEGVEDTKQACQSKELDILECRHQILGQVNAVQLFLADVDKLLALVEQQQSKLEQLDKINQDLTNTIQKSHQMPSLEEKKLIECISTVETEHCLLQDNALKMQATLKTPKTTICELEKKLDEVESSNVLLKTTVAKLDSELEEAVAQQAKEEKWRGELTEKFISLYDHEKKLRGKLNRYRDNQEKWQQSFDQLKKQHVVTLANIDLACLLLLLLLIMSVFLNFYKFLS